MVAMMKKKGGRLKRLMEEKRWRAEAEQGRETQLDMKRHKEVPI